MIGSQRATACWFPLAFMVPVDVNVTATPSAAAWSMIPGGVIPGERMTLGEDHHRVEPGQFDGSSGQKAMSALTGRPGNNCSPVTAPTNQNGIESTRTNTKNFRGDLLRDAIAFEDFSSIDCANGGISAPAHKRDRGEGPSSPS